MADNIRWVEYIGEGRLRIGAETRKWLRLALGENAMASQNFVEDDSCVEAIEKLPEQAEELLITKPFWIGMGSRATTGNFYRTLAKTKGSADLLLIWEGGEPHGLRVVDGKVTEHEVVFTLGAEVKS